MTTGSKVHSALTAGKNTLAHPGSISIPKSIVSSSGNSSGLSPTTAKTPRTPADEGVAFFESELEEGETPIRVYELPLEADGGPGKNREVCIVVNFIVYTD